MDEQSLSTKVFFIIEISSDKWWKQKLGTPYHRNEMQLNNFFFKIVSNWVVQ